MKFALLISAGLAVASLGDRASAATPAPPSGAHPRIWLTPETLAAMKANLTHPGSAAARVGTTCSKLMSKENEFVQAGIQGYNWAYSLGTCALSWRLSNNPAHGAAAVRLYRALLDDYVTMGDGAGGDGVVQHDTGYAIRFFGAYAALAYDWLTDAPGVDDALRSHTRARFKAWVDWYDTVGYLNHVPGSNMEAGYVFAKTLIAVAEGGEGGATSDAYWADVIGNLFPKDLIGKGLASSAKGAAPGGVLRGGDWPEGWQYGPMSVHEYALAARALEEHGVSFPEIRAWTDSLATRFLYGLVPAQDGLYVAGDLDDDQRVDAPLQPRTLSAILSGPSSDGVAAWAKYLRTNVATDEDMCPIYDALAEARVVTPIDFHVAKPPTTYLAPGTRNLYTRASWDASSTFAVFTAAPKLVADHQHADASNFVFYRGKDHLIIDPSPYGSRSSLTGNALAVDSNVVPPAYRPSQSPSARGELSWARVTKTGITAARAELGDAFRSDDTASDVPFARRDWVFLPEGEVVVIDRVRTDDVARKTYLRFRTQATLQGDGNLTTGVIGGSKVAIHAVSLSAGEATVSKVAVDNCWSSSDYGHCTGARLPVDQYAVNLRGPRAFAVHVIDGLDSTDTPSAVSSLTDKGVNANILGASIDRGGVRTIVASSNSMTAETPLTPLTYTAAGDRTSQHVVFDAPEDASGMSTVIGHAAGGACTIAITPGGTGALLGHPLVFSVASAADGCAVTEDPGSPMGVGAGPGMNAGGDAGSDGGAPSKIGGGSEPNGSAPAASQADPGSAPRAEGASSAPAPGATDGEGCKTAPFSEMGSPWSSLASFVAVLGAALHRRRR